MNVTASQLRRAADVKDKIESLESELSRLLGSAEGAVTPRKRRKMGAAQRARWAKHPGTKAPKTTAKPRRKFSAAARKRLAESAKARWAKARAAGMTTL